MTYNSIADSFHTETLLQTFFKRSAILDGNRPFCIFEPPFGGLYELFSLGRTAEAL